MIVQVIELYLKTMRILFVSAINDRSESSLIEYLAESGDKVTLIVAPEDPNLEKFERLGVHVIPYKIANRLDIKAALKIRSLCLKKGIETAYSSFNAGLSATLLGCMGLPTRVIAYRGTMGNLSRLDPSSYLTHLSPRLNGIVANCNAVKESLLNYGIDKSKIKIILKGHSDSWYKSDNYPTRAELNLAEDIPLIGFVANFRPLKGISTLLTATKMIKDKIKFNLLLIGDSREYPINEEIKNLRLEDTVKVLGFREDATNIAQLFDIAVLPSTRREGIARSIVEAMSHGKPCIVTSIGGLPEAVAHKENGLVVPPENAQELANALHLLLSDPQLRAQYGEKSRVRFNEIFCLSHYHMEMRKFFIGHTS
jgi:glycosyltransferase involved in cell wall biosynthesis